MAIMATRITFLYQQKTYQAVLALASLLAQYPLANYLDCGLFYLIKH